MVEEFEKRIERIPESGCWIWLGGLQPSGYGIFRRTRAHRLAWELYKGEIPDGKSVCHRCDIPSCVNPEHLFIGTQQENMVDAFKKGRLKVPSNGYALRTHCKNGHELSHDNVYLELGRFRKCRICSGAAKRRYKQRKK